MDIFIPAQSSIMVKSYIGVVYSHLTVHHGILKSADLRV